MTTRLKLLALRGLRRAILRQAAKAGTTPSAGALAHIASLEAMILAVEAMIEDEEPK